MGIYGVGAHVHMCTKFEVSMSNIVSGEMCTDANTNADTG